MVAGVVTANAQIKIGQGSLHDIVVLNYTGFNATVSLFSDNGEQAYKTVLVPSSTGVLVRRSTARSFSCDQSLTVYTSKSELGTNYTKQENQVLDSSYSVDDVIVLYSNLVTGITKVSVTAELQFGMAGPSTGFYSIVAGGLSATNNTGAALSDSATLYLNEGTVATVSIGSVPVNENFSLLFDSRIPNQTGSSTNNYTSIANFTLFNVYAGDEITIETSNNSLLNLTFLLWYVPHGAQLPANSYKIVTG